MARVCKNDRGGSHKFKNKWTTFLKTRLNCSVSGDFPFYFNEIQSTTSSLTPDPFDGAKDKIVYGVFTTADNSIAGSAVCAFKLSDIVSSFSGDFKGQESANSNWLPLRDDQVPNQRPGSCGLDSKSLNERSLNFIKSHSLMDQPVSNTLNEPLLVKTSLKERFTVIAVDPQVRTPTGEVFDVLFVGTTRGKVLKFISAKNPNSLNPLEKTNKPVIVEEIQVFPYHVSVTNVQVVTDKNTGDRRLVVLSDHEVKSLPLNRCSAVQLQRCGACVSLQDPYCAWNVNTNKCVAHESQQVDTSAFLQDVYGGSHAACVSGSDIAAQFDAGWY